MRALLVVNPKATATTPRVREVLARALASETVLEVRETKTRGHATELARTAVAEQRDLVVALGGDGTVNEVVNGLLADGPAPGLPALGVVPGGSTNVFARALGVPGHPVEAVGALLQALRADRRRRIALGRADERWFTFCAGLGLDAQVVRRVERRRAAGRTASPGLFVREGLTEFFGGHRDRRSRPLVLSRPGADDERLGVALVCNTDPWTYLGGRPVRPCPDASFDGGLDVFGLRRLGAVSTLRLLRQTLAAAPRPVGRQVLGLHDVDEVTVSAARPLPFQVDGDDLGDRRTVRFRTYRRALDVVV